MLLQSRKFWLMIFDVVISLATYFIGKYLDPESVKDILFVIGSLQPVVLAVIASITVQNVAGIKAEAYKAEAASWAAADKPAVG
jgi:putative effector of murein hydrolase